MGLFSKFRNTTSSKDIARERLKFVLLHDRADLSPAIVEQIKDEIIAVISKYVEIDARAMDVELQSINDHGTSALVANIPLITGQRRR